MKKKKHLDTKFLEFLLERQKQLEEEEEVDVPVPGEDLPKDVHIDEEEEEDLEIEDEGTDEEILERLTLQYKILKNEYENIIRN
jgi:hypothetical protein